MKVDNNSPLNSQLIEQAKAKGADKATNKPVQNNSSTKSTQNNEMVQLSEESQLMNQAAEIAKATPSVRANRIADLKARIQNGTYEIDFEGVAEKIINNHLDADFGKNRL